MINKKKKIELLAPAGDLEKMKTAFAFGADAVYLGIPDFSLRVRINDFNIQTISEAVSYAHKLKKKVYVTVNIFPHNKHLENLPEHLKKIKEMNVDGIIVSDPGIIELIKKLLPKTKLILSTQANCTNWQSAKFWKKEGVKRIILARELTLDEIKNIKDKVKGVEFETFIHGAMCMAYSGRCFLSKFFNDRSANLGDCSQPCRWNYNISAENHETLELVEEQHGSYILNSKDLCLLKRMPEILEVGLDSVKIEGRSKSVYYLANVVGAYRHAIDLIEKHTEKSLLKKELNFLYKELETKVLNRGYTEGFMFNEGKLAQNLDNSHVSSDWEFCGQVIESNPLRIKVHNTMKVGDDIEILRPDYDIIKMKIKKMVNSKNGQEVHEAHGGSSGDIVELEIDKSVSEYSVVRRRLS